MTQEKSDRTSTHTLRDTLAKALAALEKYAEDLRKQAEESDA